VTQNGRHHTTTYIGKQDDGQCKDGGQEKIINAAEVFAAEHYVIQQESKWG
jgi:hypothetical protein